MENKIFCVEIRESGIGLITHIKILDYFDNINNIIEIKNKSYELDEKKFDRIVKLTENKLINLVQIAKEQTPDYLYKNTVDGYGSELSICVGGLSFKINNAAIFDESYELVLDFMEQIKNIIVE